MSLIPIASGILLRPISHHQSNWVCGGRDNSIFSSLAPSETLIEFPWHPQPVISSPAFGVAMEMASFVC